MSLDFGPLAGNALPGPFRHVLPDGGPDELGGDGLPRAIDAGVAEVVDYFENPASPCGGHEGAGWPIGNIHDDVCSPQIHLFEVWKGRYPMILDRVLIS